jgi:hypothetical protein
MGTIELKAYRCLSWRSTGLSTNFEHKLHCGRVSERSKKAGWHHIAYVPSAVVLPQPLLRLLLVDPSRTGDEIPLTDHGVLNVTAQYLDPTDGPPYASIKIFYRPRGKPVALS